MLSYFSNLDCATTLTKKIGFSLCQFYVALYWHTIKPGTPEHGMTEHGTPAEQRNTAGTTEHHRNTEQRNAEPQRNSRNTMEYRNNVSGGIRVRIPQELDVVAFWPWNLDVVVF